MSSYTFRRGPTLMWDDKRGTLRRETWRDRLRRRLSRVLWWRQPHCVVTALDGGPGVVTVEALRWSWRRWRWERAA
jgi:hypothetical protein